MFKAAQYYGGKHQALCFNFPVLIFLGKEQDLLCNVHYAFGVVLRDTIEDIERINSHVGLWVCETD